MNILHAIEAHPIVSICTALVGSGFVMELLGPLCSELLSFVIRLFFIQKFVKDNMSIHLMYNYLNSKGKGVGINREMYDGNRHYIHPLEEEGVVWSRVKSFSSRLWFIKGRPIMYWPSDDNNDYSSFMYFRWTINWPNLLKDAAEFNDIEYTNVKKAKKKFFIKHHHGENSTLNKLGTPDTAPEDNSSDDDCEYLFWNKEDIGVGPKPDDPMEYLSINNQMAKVIRRVKFWFNNKDWFKDRQLIWKLGVLLYGNPGAGKCLGKGTPVLMYDGTVKKVEDVVVGDKLMGPDSNPKTVLATTSGREEMYRINPVKGDSYEVNKSHILSLSHDSKVVNISVREWLKKDKTFKGRAKGWRTGVDFKNVKVPIDPYLLGLWLGDGTSAKPDITTSDTVIYEYLKQSAESMGLKLNGGYISGKSKTWAFSSGSHKGLRDSKNIFKLRLRQLDLINNKHIPQIYKSNSKEVRLQLLAGLLDTDGYLGNNYYEIVQKNKTLANDIAFLARSLGLASYVKNKTSRCSNSRTKAVGTYYRVTISGHVDSIPVKIPYKKANPRKQIKDVLVTGIKVQPLGVGDYYGFELDGDGLFLLGDFTVTHNTTLIRALAEELDLPLHTFDLASMDNQDFIRAWKDSQKYKPRIVVFEDFDTVFHGRENQIESSELDFATILNCIDGIEREHGLLLFVTTNKVEHIDEALGRPSEENKEESTRAGRIDIISEMHDLDHAGRLKIASRILKGEYELAEVMAERYASDNAVKFQDRCVKKALEIFWGEEKDEV